MSYHHLPSQYFRFEIRHCHNRQMQLEDSFPVCFIPASAETSLNLPTIIIEKDHVFMNK